MKERKTADGRREARKDETNDVKQELRIGSTSSVFRLPSSGIRAVLFDAGATLLYPNPPVEEVYAREFAADGAKFSAEELDRALACTWEELQAAGCGDRYGGVRGEPAFWQTFLHRLRGRLDGSAVSAECFARLAKHFRDPSSWAVYGDVVETLTILEQRGFSLGVVSNWDSYLPTLLEGLGLRHRFRVLAVSAIEETGKPESEFFWRACARLGVAPAESLHIGDSLREDYEGARAAGLSALLLDRQDRHPGIAERIRSLSELPDLLSSAVEDRGRPSARLGLPDR